MTNNLAPIVVFCYNRPWHVEQTLIALGKNEMAADTIVYVYCDGAKNGATKDQLQKVEETRNIVRSFAKNAPFKEMHVVESATNKGLRISIITGATEVIEKYGKVIVLEDDLETSPYFLKYMNEALDKYESYRGVFSISAQSYTNPKEFPIDYPYDVYAFPTHEPTGWATWQNRWNLVEWDIDKQLAVSLAKQPYLRQAYMRAGEGMYYSSLLERLGGLDVWSVCFSLSHFKHHAVSILPIISYIHNTGFDGSGVNSGHKENSVLNHNYYLNAKREIRFLDVVYEDSRVANIAYSGTVMRRRPLLKRIINALVRKLIGKNNYILKGTIYNEKMYC